MDHHSIYMDSHNIYVEGHVSGNVTSEHNEYYPPTSSDPATLEELRKIQESLARTEPLVADAVDKLREAVEKRDQPKIREIVEKLSVGTMTSLLANATTAAGKLALRSLGIPIP